VLLVHGNADELVPISNSERLHEALKQANVPTGFIMIDGAPHGLFTGENHQTATEALVGWFEEHLL
jgi:dipeptidyl aminopeptidase/acylaminoacyl peptidase